MNFAQLSPNEVSMVAAQIDEVGRLFQGLATLSDPKKWGEAAAALKREQEAALARMAEAAAADTALNDRQNALDARERALETQSKDLGRKEQELAAREQAIAQREENWQAAVAGVRGLVA